LARTPMELAVLTLLSDYNIFYLYSTLSYSFFHTLECTNSAT